MADDARARAPDALVDRAVSYYGRPETGELWARFESGDPVPVERGRRRAYPGLPSEAPPTDAMYAIAADVLASGAARFGTDAKSILDIGCGAGTGAQILAHAGAQVLGVDTDDKALGFARRWATDASFGTVAEAAKATAEGHWDATIIDVLGHVDAPFALLRWARQRLRAGASRLLVAEPRAYPSQFLRSPARRAFSVRALTSLLAASSFEVVEWISDDGPFLVCVASAIDDPGAESLAEGAMAAVRGDGEAAMSAYGRAAAEGVRREVRIEALLSTADICFARGDGDGACRAWMQARDLDASDPRGLAGLARVTLAVGDMEDARMLALKATAIDPTDPASAAVRALVLEKLAPAEATGAWRTAASLAPDDIGFAIRFAQAASASGDHRSALHTLERVRSYGDDHGAALHVAIATALLAAGRRDDAKLEARMAQTRAPDDPDVARICREVQKQ